MPAKKLTKEEKYVTIAATIIFVVALAFLLTQ